MAMDILDKQVIVPVAAMLVGLVSLAAPVGVVWLVMHFRQRRAERLYDTVLSLADRGLPIPAQLLDPPDARRRGESAFFRAMTLVGLGFGLALLFWTLDEPRLMGIGGLTLCVGVAQILALRWDARPTHPSAASAELPLPVGPDPAVSENPRADSDTNLR